MSMEFLNPAYTPLLTDPVPSFFSVEYHIPTGNPLNIPKVINHQLNLAFASATLRPGSTVALTAGSREISNMPVIFKSLVDYLKDKGLSPVIIPAMGSHGGATPEGQRKILEDYGLTEKFLGVPIQSSMKTVHLQNTPEGIPVYMDKNAFNCDYIVPVNRIKPHTDFRGSIESGLLKMLTIGLGKQKGASTCHGFGFEAMSKNIQSIAHTILTQKQIPFGVAIIEDACHNTGKIEVIPGDQIETREKALLRHAKSLIPSIPFEKIDILLVGEMGKNLSGPGMDTNVTGRSLVLGKSKPSPEIITVLDLTDKSHGNINGIGCADITTQRLVDKINPWESFPNSITTRDPNACRLPMFMPNDYQAFQLAMRMCNANIPNEQLRMVFIKNTLELGRFYISPSLQKEATANPLLTITDHSYPLPFGKDGNLPILCCF